MYSSTDFGAGIIGHFRIEGAMMRYSVFVPKLYNLCKSLGFEPGKIMPSRAFCSDENQGFPIILITKHFGTFPFNHGMVGGVVATDRHGPHAHHGKDMVIIQASHVGYDPQLKQFGSYKRLQTEDLGETPTCGKLCAVSDWYQQEYHFARNNIRLSRDGERYLVTIDNQLTHEEREEGLILRLEKLIKRDGGGHAPVRSFSTSKSFEAADEFVERTPPAIWGSDRGTLIGDALSPDMFFYRREVDEKDEGQRHLEKQLQNVMPLIVTSHQPPLTAAMINTQVEFDRTFRSLVRERAYRGKRLFFVSGLNIDISPQPGQLFPLTKFIPWAAYYQDAAGNTELWEQRELFDKIHAQSEDNRDQIDLEDAIQSMRDAEEVKLVL